MTIVGIFIFSVLVLISGLQQPVLLIVISAVLNGATSFVYCALLIKLNRFRLPNYVRISNVRLVIMSVAVLFYGFFFIVTVLNLLGVVS